MSKPPEHLVAWTRKDAVHFLITSEVRTPLFGQTNMSGVACGRALDARQWKTCATMQSHLVTCSRCHAIANPIRNPYANMPKP